MDYISVREAFRRWKISERWGTEALWRRPYKRRYLDRAFMDDSEKRRAFGGYEKT